MTKFIGVIVIRIQPTVQTRLAELLVLSIAFFVCEELLPVHCFFLSNDPRLTEKKAIKL